MTMVFPFSLTLLCSFSSPSLMLLHLHAHWFQWWCSFSSTILLTLRLESIQVGHKFGVWCHLLSICRIWDDARNSPFIWLLSTGWNGFSRTVKRFFQSALSQRLRRKSIQKSCTNMLDQMNYESLVCCIGVLSIQQIYRVYYFLVFKHFKIYVCSRWFFLSVFNFFNIFYSYF